jgi:hypothetical protein
MSCWRLLQAKILLDAAIESHRITPKVLATPCTIRGEHNVLILSLRSYLQSME